VTIDGFTFVAQVLNFLILLALLRRFLYRPVTAALERREREIAGRVEEAEETRRAAEEEAEALRGEQARLEEERDALLEGARREADRLREELLEKAHEDIERTRLEWKRSVFRDRDAFLAELEERVTDELYASVRRALSDLADEALESRMALALLRRLESLDRPERDELSAAARRAGGEIAVTSRFELDSGTRTLVEDSLVGLLGGEAVVRFRVDASLGAGLEIRAHDVKIAWSTKEWVDRIGEAAAEALGTVSGSAEREG